MDTVENNVKVEPGTKDIEPVDAPHDLDDNDDIVGKKNPFIAFIERVPFDLLT